MMMRSTSDSDGSFLSRQTSEVLTSNIGTGTYAAPEQLASNAAYDEKCDIFSLGIVTLQLFQRFDTESERASVIERVRREEGWVPQELRHKWPPVAQLIAALTQLDPKLRPSAEEVLALKRKDLSEESKVEMMEVRIAEQAKIIANQKQLLVENVEALREKDEEIERLKKLLSEAEGGPEKR